jgi:hypothetical protein
MIVAHLHEWLHDVIWRSGPINEKEVIVSDIFLSEKSRVILLLVESNHALHIELLENLDILVRVMSISLVSVPLLDWAHECHKFTGNDPVEITVLNSLVLLVLLDIEGLEVIPLELDGVFETLETLEETTLIKAVTLGCITVGLEQPLVWLEYLVSLLRWALKDDDHEAAHQEGAIHHLLWLIGGAVVEYAIVCIVFISKQSGQFPSIPMNHGKIEWSEILVEWHIG